MNDSKSLKTIITLTKIAKVLSMIMFVLLIIGLACMLLTLLFIPAMTEMLKNVDWETFSQNFSADEFAAFKAVFGSFDPQNIASWASKALICGAIICAAQAVVAFMAYRYFKRVLEAGTPFTFNGADELKVLGIVSLCVSFGLSIVSSIIMSGVQQFELSLGSGLAPGIAFLVVSVIFRHGAELREKAEPAAALPFGAEL